MEPYTSQSKSLKLPQKPTHKKIPEFPYIPFLSWSNIKKILMFSLKGKLSLYFLKRNLLYFQKQNSALPSPNPKHKQNPPLPPEYFLSCQKWNTVLSGLNPQNISLKKLLIFLPKKNLWKNFLHFLKRKLFLYFWKWNPALFSPTWKNKK